MTNEWGNRLSGEHFTDAQIAQLEMYAHLIVTWNERFNLTTILEPAAIKSLHFEDALALSQAVNFNEVKGLADIGTGAGIPGIPLKICFPHLQVVLVEVNGKKRSFLQEVVTTLKLTNVIIIEYDWRTFLRQTDFEIDLICARASVQPEELIRMFKSSSPYKHKKLFYWASGHWIPTQVVKPYVVQTYLYSLADRQCQLVYMKNNKSASEV